MAYAEPRCGWPLPSLGIYSVGIRIGIFLKLRLQVRSNLACLSVRREWLPQLLFGTRSRKVLQNETPLRSPKALFSTLLSPQAQEDFLAQGLFSLGGTAIGGGQVWLVNLPGNCSRVRRPITGGIRDDSGGLLPIPVNPSFTIGVLSRIVGIDILFSIAGVDTVS